MKLIDYFFILINSRRRHPQSICSTEDANRCRAYVNGSSFRSAGSGCSKLKRHNACRQKSRDYSTSVTNLALAINDTNNNNSTKNNNNNQSNNDNEDHHQKQQQKREEARAKQPQQQHQTVSDLLIYF